MWCFTGQWKSLVFIMLYVQFESGSWTDNMCQLLLQYLLALKSERFNMTITEGKHNKLSRCQFNRFRVSCTFSHRSLKACKHGLYAMMVKIPSKMEIANYESEPSEISRSRKISWDFALDFVSKRLENRDRERKNLDLVSKNEIRKAKISISSRKTR